MIALSGCLAAGCASGPGRGSYGSGTYTVGSPYEINGVWYYPAVDYNYDRTGIASWYGPDFDGKYTANGEIYDMNQLTAAHTTLPLPSIVEVTDLQNGRSLQLRLNDRGPFVDGRLIDVSRRAAQLLGFETQGTAPVRVRILKEESIAAAEAAMRNSPIVVAEMGGTAAAAGPSVAAPPPASALVGTAPAEVTAPGAISPSAIAAASPLPIVPAPMAPAVGPQSAAAAAPEIVAGASFARKMPPSSSRNAAALVGPLGRLYIQAGAFSVRDNARRVEARVASLGSVEVTTASVNGIELYRVRLGPVENADEADRLLARVVDSGYPGARIVGD
jgi:rare lipoprotein A